MALTRLSYEGQGTVYAGSVSITAGSITAATSADISVSVAEAALGDAVCISPPAAGNTAGLIMGEAWVSAAGTVKVRFANVTAGTLVGGAMSCAISLSRA